MKKTFYKLNLGVIKITSKDNILMSLDLNPKENLESDQSEFNDSVMFQLQEYFKGKRKCFDIPLDLSSSSKLNESVWEEIYKIPFGETISYKELAERAGFPKAWRAVGSAVGRNPIPIIVPCHRVVAANEKLGGFSLGIDVKINLLKIEQKDGLKKFF